jgi:hypothetical protein
VDGVVERYVDKCGNAGDLLVGVDVEKLDLIDRAYCFV